MDFAHLAAFIVFQWIHTFSPFRLSVSVNELHYYDVRKLKLWHSSSTFQLFGMKHILKRRDFQ